MSAAPLRLLSLLGLCLLVLTLGTNPPGAASATPLPQVDAAALFVSDSVDALALRGTTLFWKSTCGGDFAPDRSRLRRASTTPGGLVSDLYFPADCQPDRIASANVALDGSYVYWLARDGRVLRLSQSASAGDVPHELSQTHVDRVDGFPSCCWIAVDGTYVFWSEGDSLFRAPKAGGGKPSLIYTAGSDAAITDLTTVGEGSLFFLEGSRLKKLSPTGSNDYLPTHFADGATAYALGGDRVYFAVEDEASYRVFSRSLDGSDRMTLYSSGPADGYANALAVDAANVYWHEVRNAAGGAIYRLSLGGGTAETISASQSLGSPLVSDGQNLFWLDEQGVWRLPVTAPSAGSVGDVWVTGIEVIQSVQNLANQVPLIGYKRTGVRVYVQSREDSAGPWSNVTAVLAGLRSAGYNPSNHSTITASPTGSNRATLDDSLVFVLNPEDTAPGERDLTVTLRQVSGRPEADYGNNRMTIHVKFEPARTLTIWGYTYANRNSGPTCVEGGAAPDGYTPPFSNADAHRQYMENLFPVSSVRALELPGSGTESFDNADCEGYTRAHAAVSLLVDRRWPTGSVRAFVMQPDGVGYFGWCCSGEHGNSVIRFQDMRDDPGPAMAQEFGHSYYGVFFNQHTWDEYFHYPRTDGMAGSPGDGPIGPVVGLRFAPTLSTVPGEAGDGSPAAWDFMSYSGPPNWTSIYSYCKLVSYTSSGATLCPSSVEGGGLGVGFAPSPIVPGRDPLSALLRFGPPRQTTSPYLYVAGAIQPDGSAGFEPFEIVPSRDDLTSHPTGQSYLLRLQDADGNVLSELPFDPPPSDVHPDDARAYPAGNPRLFGEYLPWNPATARITLLSSDGTQLAERLVSPSSPDLVLFPPDTAGSEEDKPFLSGTQTLAWQASDPDGDPLTYSFEYSRDGGDTFSPLAVGLTDPSYTADFDRLPGSDDAMFRVLASDGVNTSESRVGVFQIVRKVPQVTIGGLEPDAVVAADLPVLLDASATDAEDGAIDEPKAYEWTSSQDGFLGAGPWLSASLTPGEHVVTLTARDSDGNLGSATLHLVVQK